MTLMAEAMPDAVAVVEPLGYDRAGKRRYRHVTFQELDADSDRIAAALAARGVTPGTRLALLVRPGIDFVTLVFALFKAAAVAILIDPGMGRRSLVRCLAEAGPQGFIAIPPVHAARVLLRRWFPQSRLHVTVGRRWFWGGPTLAQLRADPAAAPPAMATKAEDPAAIIFTTGSTGPPKGVLFSHGNFDAQVTEIRDFYGITPGGVDLAGFPLFGLFNAAMGTTTVIPDMDPTRPARVDPAKIVEAVRDWKVTQMFGSPALWNRVGQYCEDRDIRLATVRRVLSAGAPVPEHVLRRMRACMDPGGEMYTPYGATEALPVASMAAGEVLGGTIERTRGGAGVCVGRSFPGIRWRVIRVVEGPIGSLAKTEALPPATAAPDTRAIGELIVQGPVVTREYVTRIEANRLGKIPDGGGVWHRMGDVGYFDQEGRFWFCGRLAHRVLTAEGPLYPVCCEAVFNQHPDVFRSALVGVGATGRQRPVLIVEPRPGRMPRGASATGRFVGQLRELALGSPVTERVEDFLFHPSFPVDIRHNAKIFREKLAVWAAGRRSGA
jgi:acyl-CoA synthetase (AMP-forming)/AMP-acid ligase II